MLGDTARHSFPCLAARPLRPVVVQTWRTTCGASLLSLGCNFYRPCVLLSICEAYAIVVGLIFSIMRLALCGGTRCFAWLFLHFPLCCAIKRLHLFLLHTNCWWCAFGLEWHSFCATKHASTRRHWWESLSTLYSPARCLRHVFSGHHSKLDKDMLKKMKIVNRGSLVRCHTTGKLPWRNATDLEI